MGEEAEDGECGPEQDFFQGWVTESYGKNSRTKTVTLDKHLRICSMLRGRDTAVNAKFRFWVRSKGFVLLTSNGTEMQTKEDDDGFLHIKIKAAMSPPRASKFLSWKKSNAQTPTLSSSVYRKVAIVEDFYKIIRAVHVDQDGVHAGQKKTYRMVSDQYCFLPREVVTFYLLHCKKCRPRIEKYGPLASKRKWSDLRTGEYYQEKADDDFDEELDQSDDSAGSSSPVPQLGELKTPSLVLPPKSVDTRNYGRKLTYSRETDEKLLRWVQEQTALGDVVTKEKLKEQALTLVQAESPDFKASNGWMEKFLTRHSIVLSGPKQGEPLNGNSSEWKNGGQTPGPATTPLNTMSVMSFEGIIKEPPHLNDLLQQANAQSSANSTGSATSVKDEDEDNDDDDDDDADGDVDDMSSMRRTGLGNQHVNPERLKAFNMFVRLFVDENLDRLIPISKQPKEKIGAIIMSCQRQFPEFGERARKRIRTYLKSCRRSSRLKEPLKRTADNMSVATAHIPSTQLSEVNNILAKACHNESHEAGKRRRTDVSPREAGSSSPAAGALSTTTTTATPSGIPQVIALNHQGRLPLPAAIAGGGSTPVKLSQTEVAAVQQLISGYRESAAFLYRSADELENLLRQSSLHYGQTQ